MVDNTLNLAGDRPVITRAEQRDQVAHSGLGRDQLALLTIFFIVVTYHIQNPLLQFVTQFGKAFRNTSLQPVLVSSLAISAGILIISTQAWKTVIGKVASAGLILYTLYALLAILFQFNLLGALLGIPQAGFLDQIKGDTPTAPFETALAISTVFEYLALLCTLVLWSPWERLPVYLRVIRRNAPVLIVAVVFLILWEMIINVFQIQEFLLPKPTTIGGTFIEIYPRLVSVGWNTFQNAVWGFIVGCGAGFITGMLSARFIVFSRALLPLAIAANSVPIIAFAPIINNWFGPLSPWSKVVIVGVLTYFPAMISTVRGLNSVSPLQIELMRSYAATEMAIFRKLRLPSSLPFVFSALKVGTTVSMIGAIVSEYFGGTTQGIGYRIREDAANFKYPEAWAAIIVASLLGILFYTLVSAVERGVMPWHVSFRDE
ncbi:MAG TPA: ABC transporter permease [Phototrophicaceae bacterium]|nr:ABC transporter permease [Phototrophicaceae bacterium]